MYFSRRTARLSFVRSTQSRISPDAFGTTTIGAHQPFCRLIDGLDDALFLQPAQFMLQFRHERKWNSSWHMHAVRPRIVNEFDILDLVHSAQSAAWEALQLSKFVARSNTYICSLHCFSLNVTFARKQP